MIGIYKITNTINNKIYIGQSQNIEERWRAHRSRPYQAHQDSYNCPLYRAIRKYGLNNFIFEVIEETSLEELDNREIFWISTLETTNPAKGYNIQLGGSSSVPVKISNTIALEIIQELKFTAQTQQEIANHFDISQRLVSAINLGELWVQPNEIYPIRTTIQNKEKPICPKCGKNVSRQKLLCPECAAIERRVVNRPTREQLKQELKNMSFVQIAKKYGVSDNAIRKWCDFYNLPRKSSEIKKLSEEEWQII